MQCVCHPAVSRTIPLSGAASGSSFSEDSPSSSEDASSSSEGSSFSSSEGSSSSSEGSSSSSEGSSSFEGSSSSSSSAGSSSSCGSSFRGSSSSASGSCASSYSAQSCSCAPSAPQTGQSKVLASCVQAVLQMHAGACSAPSSANAATGRSESSIASSKSPLSSRFFMFVPSFRYRLSRTPRERRFQRSVAVGLRPTAREYSLAILIFLWSAALQCRRAKTRSASPARGTAPASPVRRSCGYPALPRTGSPVPFPPSGRCTPADSW